MPKSAAKEGTEALSHCCSDKHDGSAEAELSPSHISTDDCQREPGDARGARSSPASPRAHPTASAKHDTVRGKKQNSFSPPRRIAFIAAPQHFPAFLSLA